MANIQRYIPFTATQGSADAYAQTGVVTDIIPANGKVFEITAIDIQIRSDISAISTDCQIEFSFSRDTKSAICTLDDADCIIYDRFTHMLTTSGAVVMPSGRRFQQLSGIYVVEPVLYFQFDSTGTGLTMTADARVYYEEVKLSEVEILRILNNA
jgi:hypothetical protein